MQAGDDAAHVGSAATPDLGHPSLHAVSLQWLIEFLKEHPEIQGEGLTAGQVVDRVVKPATATSSCCYVDHLSKAGTGGNGSCPAVASMGQEFYFVSHAWSRPFYESVEMLKRHFSTEEQARWRPGQPVLLLTQVFVWLDVFAINQHRGSCQKSDMARLKEVAAAAEQTLLVLDKQGTVLSRLWCLFEAWQAGTSKSGKLRMLSYDIPFNLLEQAFLELDVAQAKATLVADQKLILEEIYASGSTETINQALRDALMAAALADVPPKDLAAAWEQEAGMRLLKAARLCELYGRLEQAEPLYRRLLAAMEAALGPEDPKTLASLNSLAGVLAAQGQYEEAEKLYRRALELLEKVRGMDDPETLTAINNLAALLDSERKYTLAEPLYCRALEALLRVLGPDHADTLSSTNNLAGLLHAQGRHEEAEPLFRSAIAGMERLLGPEDPNTLTSINNLAGLLGSQGKLEEAEVLYRKALEGSEKVLGAEHPNTLAAMGNLATLLKARHKTEEAEKLYRMALAGREKVLGPQHPETLSSVKWLSDLLQSEGRTDEAKALQARLK